MTTETIQHTSDQPEGAPAEFNTAASVAILDLLEAATDCPLEAAVTVAGTLLALAPSPAAAVVLLETLARCTACDEVSQ